MIVYLKIDGSNGLHHQHLPTEGTTTATDNAGFPTAKARTYGHSLPTIFWGFPQRKLSIAISIY